MIKYREDQKELIRNNLKKILLFYGCKPGKANWHCIPHRHNNPKDDLSLNDNICCCHCGLKGDSFSVIAEIEGYNIYKEFPKIIKRGLEIIGSETPIDYRCLNNENNNKKENKKTKIDLNKYDLTKIILQNFKNSKEYNYFYKRNIRDKKLFNRYRIMTGNPKYIFPKDLLPQIYNLWSYQNIIPVWEEKRIVNIILRRDDYLSKKNKKILNLKHLELKIWNAGYIRHSKFGDRLFLTEGIFDALSIESIGKKGIALNSITMINRLLLIIDEFIDQLKENQVKFYICFDNDKRKVENEKTNSEKARDQLDMELRKKGFEVYILKLNHYKDLNDFYQKDQNEFIKQIKKISN